ncbi:MAG TPA: hypothetical protein VGL00_19075 [Terracidiphilus sp.]
MNKPKTKPDSPAHVPGTHRGEEWARWKTEPGRETEASTARNATGINAKKREPIDPRMPHLPPA